MKVIEKSNWNWTLYEENGSYFLSILFGTVGLYEQIIEIHSEEFQTYEKCGSKFLDEFSEQVRNSPGKFEARMINQQK